MLKNYYCITFSKNFSRVKYLIYFPTQKYIIIFLGRKNSCLLWEHFCHSLHPQTTSFSEEWNFASRGDRQLAAETCFGEGAEKAPVLCQHGTRDAFHLWNEHHVWLMSLEGVSLWKNKVFLFCALSFSNTVHLKITKNVHRYDYFAKCSDSILILSIFSLFQI